MQNHSQCHFAALRCRRAFRQGSDLRRADVSSLQFSERIVFGTVERRLRPVLIL
jgi:hypothetical protein